MNQQAGFFAYAANLFWIALPIVTIGSLWLIGGAILVLAFLLGLFIIYSLRMVTRHVIMWRARESMYLDGGLQWFKITPDHRKSLGNQMEKAHNIVTQVDSTLRSNVDAPAPYLSRGVVSIMWKKDKPKNDSDAPKLTCFIGVSKNRLRGSSTANLSTMASALGGTLTKINGTPNFKTNYTSFAKLNDITMGKVSDGKKTSITPVSESILAERDFYGVIVMTVEMMRARSEESRWKRYIAQLGSKEVGSAKEFSGMSAQRADYMMEHSFRTCLATGSYISQSSSDHMLNSVSKSLNEAGCSVVSHDPAKHLNRKTVVWWLLFEAISVGAITLGLAPMSQAVALMVVAAIPGVSALINAPWMGRVFLDRALSSGYIVIPPFLFFSPRYMYMCIVNFYMPSAGSGNSTNNRFAIPSDKQVIPFHHVPIASLLALPNLEPDKDVDSMSLPEIGIPKDVENSMTSHDSFIGIAGEGQKVYFPLSRINFPLFTAGSMGSGKSNFMQVQFLNLCFQGYKKANGFKITPIWGETKGKGAYEAWDLVKEFPGALFLDVNNPNSRVRVALEGPRLGEVVNGEATTPRDVFSNAMKLTELLRAAWGDSVGPSSAEAISYSIATSMLLNEDELRMMDLIPYLHPTKPNVIKLAHILLGNDSQYQVGGVLKSLRESMHGAQDGTREGILYQAIGILEKYNDPKNREYRQRAAAPQNKMSKLVQARSFFEASDDRDDIYVEEIVTHGAPIVINTGAYKQIKGGVEVLDSELTEELISDFITFLTSSMWSTIKRIGNNWEYEGIRVPLFFDEVADITREESDGVENMISQMCNLGRGFGTGIEMGTQNMSRLRGDAAEQVLAADSSLWFRQNATDGQEEAVRQLGATSQFTIDNIKRLGRGVGVGTINTNDGMIGPFVLHVPYAPEWKKYLMEHGDMLEASQAYVDDKMREKSVEAVW